MTALPPRFVEDRRLRDAARAVLEEDIARLRASLEEQGVASRVSSSVSTTVTARIRAGAGDVLAQAKQSASDHPGIIALVIGAIMLWLLRGTVLDMLETLLDNDADAGENATMPDTPDTEQATKCGERHPEPTEEQAA